MAFTYYINAVYTFIDALNLWNLFLDTGNPLWDYESGRLLAVSAAFLHGANAIGGGWQHDYSFGLVGNGVFDDLNSGGQGDAAEDDGFIPNASQAPTFTLPSQRLRAEGVNHAEETASPAALEQIQLAMRNLGIPESGQGTQPLSASISGPSTVNGGQTYTWSASASGGVPSYSYEWKYRQICPLGGVDSGPGLVKPNAESCDSTWRSGGTGSTFRKAFYGSFKHSVQLRVRDAAGSTDLSYKTITIQN